MKVRVSKSYRESIRDHIASEYGSIPRPGAYDLKIAAVFPNTYSVGMASLGFQWIINIATEQEDVLCERVFLPERSYLSEMERSGEQIVTYESFSQLSSFDVVAFSLQYEMDYANAVRILQSAKIPARRADRDQIHPIVIAGGPCSTFNPEPMLAFVDIFVVGDAEPVLSGLIRLLKDTLRLSREARLHKASELEGVYVPGYPQKVQRAFYDGCTGAISSILTENSQFGRIRLVEISRGCGRRCRFCVAGHIGRPVRFMDLKDYPRNERVGLVGAAVLDHPQAFDYCQGIVDSGGSLTMSSIRLETLDERTCAMLNRAGVRTVTIAPEAGSRRLRKVLNKDVDDERIIEVAKMVWLSGIGKLRMYFMIGLPTETDQDILQIIELVRTIKDSCPNLKLGVSVSSYVPKPFTPFQWHAMASTQTLKHRYAMLRSGLGSRSNVEFSGESPRLAFVQGLLARGDSSLADMIEQAAGNGDYLCAIRQTSVDVDRYIYEPRSREQALPWDHIDLGISKEYLWSEYQLALKEMSSGPCDIGTCRTCGACI